jgi:hypothetical protein
MVEWVGQAGYAAHGVAAQVGGLVKRVGLAGEQAQIVTLIY